MQKYEREKLYSLDKEAVESLVLAYRYPLTYFVVGYVKDLLDAEDIVSEAIVKLLVKRPRLRSGSALKTYLFSTAKNLAIDFLRKKKKQVKTGDGITDEKGFKEIEEQLFKTEESRRLREGMEKLNEGYSQVLYLHYFEELDVEEICKVLHKNKKQVYNLLARAKKGLADILGKEGLENEEL